jgi:hypothetical protein
MIFGGLLAGRRPSRDRLYPCGSRNASQTASYGAVVNEGFRKGGKPMFTRRNEGYESPAGNLN